MKVEFVESPVFKATITVSAEDFLKAKDDMSEFDSLYNAIDAFAALFELNFNLLREEYDVAAKYLKESGKVIFTTDQSIYVQNEGQEPIQVCYTDETGGRRWITDDIIE